jgi:hypothetical protein
MRGFFSVAWQARSPWSSDAGYRSSGPCTWPEDPEEVPHLADLLRRPLKEIRSRWRILPPGKIAVIVLAVLRHDQRLASMAGGNNESESTRPPLARRADRAARRTGTAPGPRPEEGRQAGRQVVLIDGTLIRTLRRTERADRRNYSGKQRRHGLHLKAAARSGDLPPGLAAPTTSVRAVVRIHPGGFLQVAGGSLIGARRSAGFESTALGGVRAQALIG